MEFYLVCRGNLYLHIDPVNGATWGKRAGAFEFFDMAEASRIGMAMTPKDGKSNVVLKVDKK